jgi:hypothetical protein
VAGTGRGLGWLVLSLFASGAAAAEADPAMEPPSRELLLYLAQFDGATEGAVDPLELEALSPEQVAAEQVAAPVREDEDEKR